MSEDATRTDAGGPLQRLFGAEATVARDRAFQVLLLGSVISPIGSSVVSPVLEALAGPYGVSIAQVGLLMSAFTAPSIVAIPLVGALSDRIGRRPVLVAGLVVFGLAGGAAALTTDFRVVVGLRLVQGLGYTGIGPVLITSVGDLYAGEREATAQGLRFATVGLSLAAFPVLAGFLVGLNPRLPFALFVLALPVAVVVLLTLEEPTESGPPDGGADGAGIDPRDDTTTGSGNDGGATLTDRLRDPFVLGTLVGRAVPSFLWFAFLTYASVLTGRVLGAPPSVAGLTVGLASLGSAVGGTQVGRLTGAFESRRLPLAGTMLVAGVGLALFGLAPSVAVAMVGAALVGIGFGTVLTIYRSTVTGLAGARARGGLVSAGESVGRVGSTAAPVILGVVVAAATPALGFEQGLRYTLVGTAAVGTAVGLALAAVAARAHTTAADRRA